MSLGIILLVIFILYLIDKHNKWRIAAKITGVLLGIAVIALVCLYEYSEYQSKKSQAAAQAYEAKMKPIWDCEKRNAQFSNADVECENNPAVVLVPKTEPPLTPPDKELHPARPLLHVKALHDTDLTTEETGSLKCGHIAEGETATMLRNGNGYGIRIRTADGQTGWAYAGYFETVKTMP